MQPKVSVLMSVFNAEPHLRDAVKSILAQTFEDFEVLIINDGSTDGSARVLSAFTDPRIRIFEQENRGLVPSLNRGLREARGQYIARMDADDICTPRRLKLQVDYLDSHPQIALVGGFVATMDEEGNSLAPMVRFPIRHEEIWSKLGRRPWVMCHPTVMYRHEVAVDIGMYNPAFAHAEDVEFFARMMSRYRAINLPEVILHYRLRRGAVSVTRKDHGRVNAQLVAEMIAQWRPGQPLAPTQDQRRSADAAISASRRPITSAEVEAMYQCRVARELLRGRQWLKAAQHYADATRHNRWDWLPYAGILCALLRIGGTQEARLEE
jgi:glycosyltransferase involved in cell wall biosynthesis